MRSSLNFDPMGTLHLDNLLSPRSIAVVGASSKKDSPGYMLAKNLINGDFRGPLHFVNPRHDSLFGKPCFRSVKALPDATDIALVMTPPDQDRKVLTECSERGIRVVAMMSPERRHGGKHARELRRLAVQLGLRILGPWCAGIVRTHIGLNATYAALPVEPGSLAVVSQSAALAAAIVDWGAANKVGFSSLISTGSEFDVSIANILDLLSEDSRTRAVIVYLDTFQEKREFLSALSATARIKPVIVMSTGQNNAPFCDALARTGAIMSTEAVMQAALQRAGAVRIRSFGNLFAASRLLAHGKRIRGNRVAVLANGRAPATIALEQLPGKGLRAAQFELPLSTFSPRNAHGARLRRIVEAAPFLGDERPIVNPVVIRSPDTLALRYREAVEALLAHEDVDAVIAILVPDMRIDSSAVARSLADIKKKVGKPLLCCLMGDASLDEPRQILADAQIPTLETPEQATSALDFLYRHHVSGLELLELPRAGQAQEPPDHAAARAIIHKALDERRRVLDPTEARQFLEAFHVPVLPIREVRDSAEAIVAANDFGYPVVIKARAERFAYKSSLLPAQLGIRDADGVAGACRRINDTIAAMGLDGEVDAIEIEPMLENPHQRELSVTLHQDATFGPVISVGVGGDLRPLWQRVAVQLPPLSETLIDKMLAREPFETWFGPYRHKDSLPTEPIRQLLLQISEIACECPEIHSLDINPLIVSADGAVAVDTQIVVEKTSPKRNHGHLAIPPYPREWERQQTLKSGLEVTIRPIRPEDGEQIEALVRNMSEESRYFRFMHAINRLSPQMVAQFTKLDYDRQIAFVAEVDDRIIGVSRYILNRDRDNGEFALSIADEYQGHGLGKLLMKMLIEHAEAHAVTMLQGDVLKENNGMQHLMQSLGFERHAQPDSPETWGYRYAISQP
ncbi:MAG: hypothetical protein CSB44_10610 [Gammaproteobacteria bacterium]|nr:MAG: hypothetical protein CSB44_10610 [Gammaproteobacteria bacterium]